MRNPMTRISVASHRAWQEDHTRPLFSRSSLMAGATTMEQISAVLPGGHGDVHTPGRWPPPMHSPRHSDALTPRAQVGSMLPWDGEGAPPMPPAAPLTDRGPRRSRLASHTPTGAGAVPRANAASKRRGAGESLQPDQMQVLRRIQRNRDSAEQLLSSHLTEPTFAQRSRMAAVLESQHRVLAGEGAGQ